MSFRQFQTNSPVVNVMAKAAFKASRGLRRDFGEVEHLQVSQKGPRDFVTEADRRSERCIQQELSKARPGYGFLMEESGAIAGQEDWTWVVDPLDGTFNFLHGVPHFCISIGLLKGQEPYAGVIYDPLRDELFWAEKGMGAFLHEKKIRASARKDVRDSLLGISHFPFQDPQADALFRQGAGFRNAGSAALDLAYVASGRLDGFLGHNLRLWDMAAGIVLVREAGGRVTDWQGRAYVSGEIPILATNSSLSVPALNAMRETER